MPSIPDRAIPLSARNLPQANVPEKKRSDSSSSDDENLPLGFPSPAPTPEPTFHKNLLVCGMIAFVVLPLAGAALYFVIESLKKNK